MVLGNKRARKLSVNRHKFHIRTLNREENKVPEMERPNYLVTAWQEQRLHTKSLIPAQHTEQKG